MTRFDGRADDELRPITFERDYTEMAAGSVLVTFGKTRVLLHGVDRRERAAVDEELRQGLGHGRVLDAAGRVARADRSRSGQGQAERPHRRDPTSDRSLVARRVRHATARRASGRRRLRRAAGRRRHADRQHLRRVPRARTMRLLDWCRTRPSRRTRCTRSARRSASASSVACRCSTFRTSRIRPPRST